MIDTQEQLQQLLEDRRPLLLERGKTLPTSIPGGIITLFSPNISQKINILASAKDLFDRTIPKQLHRADSFYGSDTFYLEKISVSQNGSISVRVTRRPTLRARSDEFKTMYKQGTVISTEIRHVYGKDIWAQKDGVWIHTKRLYNSHQVYAPGQTVSLKLNYQDPAFPIAGEMTISRLALTAVQSDMVVGRQLTGVIVAAKPYGVFVKVSPTISILSDVPEPHIIDGVVIGREVLLEVDKVSNHHYHGVIIKALLNTH